MRYYFHVRTHNGACICGHKHPTLAEAEKCLQKYAAEGMKNLEVVRTDRKCDRSRKRRRQRVR